jgi:predicted DNA-binding transcriptional regulator AlpA
MTNLLTERECAERLALSLATLRRRRCEGRPPKWIKIGASVRYRLEDLEEFIDASVVKLDGKNKECAA